MMTDRDFRREATSEEEEEESIPVEVTNPEPLKVEIKPPDAPTPVRDAKGKLSLPPTTTEQEDIVTAGQQRVNIIWEITQAVIAVTITLAIIYTAAVGTSSDALSNAFFLIIGFYFSRTNHQAIGGIGRKPSSEYRGR